MQPAGQLTCLFYSGYALRFHRHRIRRWLPEVLEEAAGVMGCGCLFQGCLILL